MFNSEYLTLNVESLGKPIHVVRDKLEHIISSSCSSLTNELQTWLKSSQASAELEQVSIHTITPSELDQATTCTLQHEAGGKVYISSDSALLIKLADSFYDAKIDRTTEVLSHSDLRLQERLGQLITSWLAPEEMWECREFESNHGTSLWAKITINLPEQKGSIHIKLDERFIDILTNQLDLQSNDSMYSPFCRSLTNTPVKLNVLLSKKDMPLSDLIALKPDDVLPIELLSTVPVSIGDKHLFNGRVAEKEGQLVLIINQDKETRQ